LSGNTFFFEVHVEPGVLVNGDPVPDRHDLPPYGAGEGSHKPMIAAVANAIHDATGVRLRRAPFRSERVLAALRASTR
jgi:CO/xanthine dehydrogenase Mo-binding subunit